LSIFFTSDQHYYHPRIIQYEQRPFNNVEEMNEAMIEKHNKKISKKDSVYFLGDFSFGTPEQTSKLLDRLNGNKHMVLGNHDKVIKTSSEVRNRFAWVKDYYRLMYNGHKIILFHYPISVYDCMHHGSYHCYGHIHSNKDNHHPIIGNLGKNTYNVGVDVNNYEPVSFEEILNILSAKF